LKIPIRDSSKAFIPESTHCTQRFERSDLLAR